MADESHDNSGTPSKAGEVTFTPEQQEKLNAIVSERVNEVRKAQEKATADAVAKALKDQAEKTRIESLQGEERIKAEYQAKLDQAEADRKAQSDRLAAAERDLAISKAQAQLAALDLPPDFAVNLLGSDDKETARNIQAFNAKVSELVAAKVNDSLARGAPKIGGEGAAQETWKQEIDRAFKKGYRLGGKT